MVTLNPQMLTLMQDLSGWVLAGRCSDAAAALGRWSEIRSDFSPWAAGASAIARLTTAPELRQRGFLQLLTSPELAPLLTQTPPDEVGRLELGLRIEGDRGLLGAEQSLLQVVEGMFAWEPDTLRAILGGVIEAGGLGDLALAVEKARGGLPGLHFSRARAALHALTEHFRSVASAIQRHAEKISFSEQFTLSELVSEGARRFLQTVESTAAPEIQKDLILLCGLQNFLEAQVYASLPHRGQLFLTDLLQQAPEGRPVGLGSCAPSSVLTAHVAHAAGISLDSLIHNCSHISLALRRTPLVVDSSTRGPWFRSLEEWRGMGLLGKGQHPGPLLNLLSSYVNSVVAVSKVKSQGPEFFRQGLEASSRICPDHFGALINRAYLDRARPETTRDLIDRLSTLDPDSPWIPYLEAYFYLGRGERPSAMATFEYCFRLCLEEGIKMLDGAPVPLISGFFLEPAIEEYARVGLELGHRLRIRTTLQRLRNYPDPRIQRQAALFLMMLDGGGAQA